MLNRNSLVKSGQRMLQFLLFSNDYSDYRRPKRYKLEDITEECSTIITSRLKLSDILSYAHKISYTTFAPPKFGAGHAPLRGTLPPAPQEEQMRASQLYGFADLDVGLPKTDEGKEKTIEPMIETPDVPSTESNPLASLAGIQSLLPSNIVVPPGWKPGMPVELPGDLPILPPPGWKPGDPVSLPPLDSVPMPPRSEEHQPLAIPPAALLKAPEPTQVRQCSSVLKITAVIIAVTWVALTVKINLLAFIAFVKWTVAVNPNQ